MPHYDYQVPLAPHARMGLVSDIDWPLVEPYGWYEVKDGRATYAYANHEGTTVKMHRLVLGAALGRPLGPQEVVDHINGNGIDNRRSNLRLATHSQNHANAPKPRTKNPSSQYKGVYWYPYKDGRPRWRAMLRVGDGKRISLGYFDDEAEAARAYDRAHVEHFGEFARPNFPQT